MEGIAGRQQEYPGVIRGEVSGDISEEEFLKNYRPGDYERPSVTADILVFTLSERGELSLLLIQRGNHPFKGCWALPGGFVDMEESLDEAARRELFEETGLKDIYMEQLATFGDVGRDPRMRVISVAYLGLAPKDSLPGRCRGKDDAKEACLFQIKQRPDGSFVFINEDWVIMFAENELAFDHARIIHEGVNRIRGKLNYTDIAFELLENRENFTMADLRVAYEAISGVPYPASNFTRNITTRYIKPGKMVETKERVLAGNGTKVALYGYRRDGVPDPDRKDYDDVGAGIKNGNMYGVGAGKKKKDSESGK
ncbi:MAG: NUDIX hydrolase [Lachnospiraceae bacterium]|nr:NUDIX hydrolase [Lachnospiraceae bacterium]